MSKGNLTGLGNPETMGKEILFQTPEKRLVKDKKSDSLKRESKSAKFKRIKTTLELTSDAMKILFEIQNQYRLKTGKVLPLWEIVSDALLKYGKLKERGKNENL